MCLLPISNCFWLLIHFSWSKNWSTSHRQMPFQLPTFLRELNNNSFHPPFTENLSSWLMYLFPIKTRCVMPPNWRQMSPLSANMFLTSSWLSWNSIKRSIKASKRISVEWSKQNSIEIKSLQPPFATTLSSWLIRWLLREWHRNLREREQLQTFPASWLLHPSIPKYPFTSATIAEYFVRE